MDEKKTRFGLNTDVGKFRECTQPFVQAYNFMVQIPQQLQNCIKSNARNFAKNKLKPDVGKPEILKDKGIITNLAGGLDKQLKPWRESSGWVDPDPEIKVTIPKGSLSNLHVQFEVGLPPDAIFNILTDPGNRRVFKSIKEVISRRVLVDEGPRQVVEVDQAAIWRFLWWSGTISVHVIVDQDRSNHTVKFIQGRSGFMKRFEGCWKLEPLFVDEQQCSPYRPKTIAEYESCTKGQGRIASLITLDQLIEPALVPPPPISWYLRGITTKTTEMLITDLLAEAARIRNGEDSLQSSAPLDETDNDFVEQGACDSSDIKKRWRLRRGTRRQNKHGTLPDLIK